MYPVFGGACGRGQTHRKTMDGRCLQKGSPFFQRGSVAPGVPPRPFVCGCLCAQLASIHGACLDACMWWSVGEWSWELCLQDCTAAANPDGVSGREWCYVEAVPRPPASTRPALYSPSGLFTSCPNCSLGTRGAPCQEQVANAGRQKWDYCAPKPNYAEVRG